MNWADFYLVCFLVGFSLSLVSLLLGHLNLHLHLPHGWHFHWGGGAHGGGMHSGGIHAGGHAAGGGHGAAHAHGGHHGDAELSPLNFATITAFLAWFGGGGYILTRYFTFWHLVGLGLAVLFGLVGAAMVFWMLSKLMRKDENLDPADYQVVGALGRVVSGIRQGGTGEIVYVLGGVRQTAGARSEDGTAIPKKTEVVVTRYEKGIAYVRRWDELTGECAATGDQVEEKH